MFLLYSVRKSTSKLKSFYNENKTPVLIVLGLFLVWKLRGLFSAIGGVGDTLGTVIGGATSKIQVSAQAAADKSKLESSLPAPAAGGKTYKFTAADTARYRAAAAQCATALGTMPGQIRNYLFTDDAALYAAIKPYGYARLGTGGKALVDAKGAIIPRAVSGRYDYVLAPFYQELTGNSLQVDLDAAFPVSPGFASSADFKARCSFYRKYLRVR